MYRASVMGVPSMIGIMIHPLAHSPQFRAPPSGYIGVTGLPVYPLERSWRPLFESRRLHLWDETEGIDFPSFGSLPRQTCTSKAPRSLLYSSRICLYWKKVALAPVSFTWTVVPGVDGAAGGDTGAGGAVTVWVTVTVVVGAAAGASVEQPVADITAVATTKKPAKRRTRRFNFNPPNAPRSRTFIRAHVIIHGFSVTADYFAAFDQWIQRPHVNRWEAAILIGRQVLFS